MDESGCHVGKYNSRKFDRSLLGAMISTRNQIGIELSGLSFSQIESALVMATKSNGKPLSVRTGLGPDFSDEVQRWTAGVREHR